MDQNKSLEMFRSMPVGKAIMKNCIPTMAMSLMMVVYNLADTYFVAKTGDPLKVAAVAMAMPVFLIYMALGVAFGVGGVSVISRALGEGRMDYAKKVSAFCTWACIGLGIVVSAVFLIFAGQILKLIGASDDLIEFAKSYFVVVAAGGTFIMLSNCYSNLLRAEGQVNKATIGMVGGNILNIILDPILILFLGWGVSGAAFATVVSAFLVTIFYLVYLLSGKSILSIKLRDFTIKEKVFSGVLAIGAPAAVGPILMSFATVFANSMVASYNDLAVAGFNVATRTTMITSTLTTGLGQGIQPLMGFNFGAKNWKRFKSFLKTSLFLGSALAIGLTLICYVFLRPFIGAFFESGTAAYDYGVRFGRILLSTSFLLSIIFVLLNTMQAIGAAIPSLVVNLSRQGILYVPALLIGNALLGIDGLAWAQPVVDVITMVLAIALFIVVSKKRLGNEDELPIGGAMPVGPNENTF